ncbi:hypothetical protein [Paenibacillus shenyangensis]|uniref:hypothetical protein n=1 Tax=Paenibacillus sp. A9 TaxID=1284352 RepID=UPI000382B1D9|nr:hypothetical protein [Paenibacillus sp. A9]
MGLTVLMYSLAFLVVGVIVLAFYTTVQTYKVRNRELELQQLELQLNQRPNEPAVGSHS